MITHVIIRRLAKRDIRDARDWYRRISSDLGEDFVERVDEAIALATEHPLAFPLVFRSFRRILLHRFPYALFYAVTADRLSVVAVLHQARDQRVLETR